MSRILKRPAAIRDLVAIGRYIRREDGEAAERFLVAAEETFHRLAVNPTLGRPRHFQRRPGLRSWQVQGFQKYLVFYKLLPDGIEIKRVLHGARDLRRLLTRKSLPVRRFQ
jgi:toxin ParE1/3/4